MSSRARDRNAAPSRTAAARPVARSRTVIRRILSGGITITIFVIVIPRLVDLREVWSLLTTRVSLLEAATLSVLAIASLVATIGALMASLPGLRTLPATLINLVTTAVAYGVPAGGAAATALTAGMMRTLGFSGGAITRSILATGAWNLASRFLLPIVALLGLAVKGDIPPFAKNAALLGVALLLVLAAIIASVIASERRARALGRLVTVISRPVMRLLRRREPANLSDRFARFRLASLDLIKMRSLGLSLGTFGYQLALFAVLWFSLRAVGLHGVGVAEAFAAFVAVRQLTALPITPGSAGILELLLIGGLRVAGAQLADAAAGVFLFRAFTYLFYLPLGGPLWLFWRARYGDRSGRENQRSVAPSFRSEQRAPNVRSIGDLLVIGSAGVILAITTVMTRSSNIPSSELDIFRTINHLSDALFVPLWVVMQVGSLTAVPLSAGLAFLLRRRRLAVDLTLAGVAAWVAAKVFKIMLGRPRPVWLIEDMILRGAPDTGIGFPAGHAAVVGALAAVATAHVRRPVRRFLWAIILVSSFARVYVGAHLPLDMVGGVAFGWVVGTVVRFARGHPGHGPAADTIAGAIEHLGIPVRSVEEASGDRRRAMPFVVTTGGERLFVKAIGRDQRDADVFARTWRFLAYREPIDEPPFATPKHQLEHEAYVMLVAARAGCRAPAVRFSSEAEPGVWLLATEYVDGVPIDRASIHEGFLDELWAEARRLHAAGVAHRDLRAANILLDPDGVPRLVGFGGAQADAGRAALDADVAQLLVTTAIVTDEQRAAAAAARACDAGTLERVSALLHPLVMPRGMRAGLRRGPLLPALRAALAERTGLPVDEALTPLRIRSWAGLMVGVFASVLAFAYLSAFAVSPSDVWTSVRVARGDLLLVAVAASTFAFSGAAATVLGIAGRPLAFGRTVAVQLAAAASSIVAPPAHGSARANAWYLRTAGVDPEDPGRGLAASRAAAILMHGVALLVAVAVAVARLEHRVPPMNGWRSGILAIAGLAVGIVLGRQVHRRAIRPLLSAAGDLGGIARSPSRSLLVFGGSTVVLTASVVTFLASLAAFGVQIDPAASIAIVLCVTALAPLGPLPRGLGVVEAGMITGLMIAGATPPAGAVAAVATYRIITVWLPLGPGLLAMRALSLGDHHDPFPGRWTGIPRAWLHPRPAPTPGTRMPYVLHPADIVRAVSGLTIALMLSLVAAGGFLLAIEVDLFRGINRLPGVLFIPVRALMQAGALAAVPVVAAIALFARRRRLAIDLLIGGSGAWLLAKAVKVVADRGRPGALLDEVVLRGSDAGGLGFLSGHAAVAAALAGVASAHVIRPVRWFLWSIAIGVAASRVYVGAHFPFDVVAGLALGWAVGGGVHLARGTPPHLASAEQVRDGLAQLGLDVDRVEPLREDARGSIPFIAGDVAIVKALGRDQRDADLLFKMTRFVVYRELEDEAPFATPKRSVEHEAYLLLLAARAGMRVPRLLAAGGIGDGVWVLAEQRIDGRSLATMRSEEITDGMLLELWRQIGIMRAARIAHRDLRRANVMVDREGTPWIIDFGFAEAGAGERRLANDIAEALASLSVVVGAQRAVRTCVRALGAGALDGVTGALQPLALARATRLELRAGPSLLEQLAREVRTITDEPDLEPEPLTRLRVRPLVLATSLAASIALYAVLIGFSGATDPMAVVGSLGWRWIGIAAIAVVIRYVAAALLLGGASSIPLALGRTTAISVAASFASRMHAPGRGSPRVLAGYLRAAGLPREHARDTLATASAIGVGVHLVALCLALAATVSEGTAPSMPASRWLAYASLAGAAAVVGAIIWRRQVRGWFARVRATLPGIEQRLRGRGRALESLTGAFGVTSGSVLASIAVVRAVGLDLPVGATAAVFLLIAPLGALGPIWGGIGVVEPALIVGLSWLGAPFTEAVIAVLVHRVLTFWLPIAPAAVLFRRLHLWSAAHERGDARAGPAARAA